MTQGKQFQGTSIHPPGSRGTPRNVAARRNPDVTRRKIAAVESHLERHPRDGSSQSHLALLKGRL